MKKFGTFSGVFTPSILTILGVIMYLRFPAIIGQAGLIDTIGIIVIAHIISVTTSLSVASLSTDKTVKTGGTYFMISRSLGLPIGGTLGLALFVGLSFSVSLYLIGFAESFLAYWNLDNSIDSIRLTGTIILIVVTTITFISTSLAIKSQYFIMAAIGLSLLSIFFGNHDFAPEKINLAPLANAAPFMVLFGIFFPAVTGFEAGVSMSGDLKNPKKSLPLGAISAVAVGFVVYIGLAFFYAFTVDSNALMNDSEILFKIALVPGLVIIGIWGATLSSALGSILGAPRILQAIAMDKIAPKFFAKGTGKTNEPRNALLLSFVIAEAGILIGELDVIARIVSMFFITTYAFLNLASAIESWSSSDFRPAFKIPRFVSILGAVSAFIVMILLDFLALAGAVVVLGFLFFYLKRKELVLETGDAWSSFWTNLAKHSLLRLNKEKVSHRNWRPNIILFSGGEQARPHLVELGLALSGKLGALTDFELVLKSGAEGQLKPMQEIPEKGKYLNFFKRQFACETVEGGIKTVTSVYGFSGFEPNTILMGWTRNMENAEFLVNVLADFKRKNLNAIFLDYDKQLGFGKKETIDIWWNGKGRHLNFALGLLSFLLTDPAWRDAKIRLLIINNDNTITDKLYRNTSLLLEERRISAEVKILSNDFGTRTSEMVILSESENTDLVLLGISEMTGDNSKQYIEKIRYLTELSASLLILSPSEEFEEINLIGTSRKKLPGVPSQVVVADLQPLPLIENDVLREKLAKLEESLLLIGNTFTQKVMSETINYQSDFLSDLKDFTLGNLNKLEKYVAEDSGIQLSKNVNRLHFQFLNFITDFFDKKGNKAIADIKELLLHGISEFNSKGDGSMLIAPENIIVPDYDEHHEKEKKVTLPYRRILSHVVNHPVKSLAIGQLAAFNSSSVRLYADLKRILLQVNDIYEKQNLPGNNRKGEINEAKQQLITSLESIESRIQALISENVSAMVHTIRNQVIEIASDALKPDAKKLWSRRANVKQTTVAESIEAFPDLWESDNHLVNNALFLDCHILTEQKMIGGIIRKNNNKISSIINESVIEPIKTIITNIDNSLTDISVSRKEVVFSENFAVTEIFQEAYQKISEFIEKLPARIEITDYSYDESSNESKAEERKIETVEPGKIALYYMDTRFFEPFYRELEQLDLLVRQSIIECREANSLIKFRLDNVLKNNTDSSIPESDISGFLSEMRKQVLSEKTKLTQTIEKIIVKSDVFIKNALSPLYSHAIIESEAKISSFLREQKGKKFSVGISEKIAGIKSKINALIVDLLYSSSDGMILAQKYLKKKGTAKTSIRQILDIAEKQMPEKKVLSQIPVFYRTLFSSRSLINDDFWVPMDKETTIIKNAIKRHKDGYGGAVMITGVHGSGKTALTRYVCNRFFKKERTFFVKSSSEGSVNIENWQAALREATGGYNNSFEILQAMPHESVIIINDFELWWERSENGLAVIKEITELIRVFGKKVFFILNCNTYSYNQINKVFPIQDYFLSVVECRQFDTKQLQQLILNRHKSSGLTFNYGNTSEQMILQVRMASFFHSYFNYSQGVQGVAMNAWIRNIYKVEQQNIFISKPAAPYTENLENIVEDWIVLIALFIQHKNMNAQKLSRVMDCAEADAANMIYNLSNAGILELREKDVFTLNRYLEPFLVKVCADKGII